MNLREIVWTAFRSRYDERYPEWHDWTEFLKYTIWDATDILLSHAALFHERGFQRLNIRNVEFIERVSESLSAGKIDYKQAINFLGEWLGIMLAKEPSYILVLREVSFRILGSELTKSTNHLFINIFIGGYIFEMAEFYRANKVEAKAASERPTKSVVNNFVKQREEVIVNRARTTTSERDTFKCLMTPEQISVLHEQLIFSGYISGSVPYEVFSRLFDNKTIQFSTPIVWHSKTVYLAYLFYALYEEQQLIDGNWQTLIGDRKKAFESKRGSIVTTSSFSSNLKNIKDKKHQSVSYRRLFASIMQAVIDAQ